MSELDKQFFIGIKISTKLQSQLDNPAPGTERYFKENNTEYLQIVTLGGTGLSEDLCKTVFPSAISVTVDRNVRSIVSLITRGDRFGDDAVHIYVR